MRTSPPLTDDTIITANRSTLSDENHLSPSATATKDIDGWLIECVRLCVRRGGGEIAPLTDHWPLLAKLLLGCSTSKSVELLNMCNKVSHISYRPK